MSAEPGTTTIVGLMSGTSLDGISAAAARFSDMANGVVSAELLGFISFPYEPAQRERLLEAMRGGDAREYCRLSFDLGGWLAEAALEVMRKFRLGRGDVAAIASHGQTLWHEPGHSTWQLGEAAVIAERVGVPVVGDFRVRDVAAGGQGAPLVSIADALLFSHATRSRALQNIGGIGNVTIVPPGGMFDGMRAFDTGPGVAVIDGVTRALVPGTAYDIDGKLARNGNAIEPVVLQMLEDPFFTAEPPKSTGRELFSSSYIERFMASCRSVSPQATDADIVATAVSLTARSIGDAYRKWVPAGVEESVLSGGGAKNPALVDAIAAAIAPKRALLFDNLFFDGEAKEAVAFALLGYLHMTKRSGNVPGATGARGARILGKWTPA
ncbi:MAG: anhydro-N-acetylmuramic acid kinase [Anaerolineae bacterium]|nr:anhydro-N-acetylmuramic acid kinase [Gemmatimonadaceae bacterium]